MVVATLRVQLMAVSAWVALRTRAFSMDAKTKGGKRKAVCRRGCREAVHSECVDRMTDDVHVGWMGEVFNSQPEVGGPYEL